ncbi:tyrosine phosphatase [Rhizoctonia solani 123E]|uniref:Very-long-chain (3R)-3-hydroxyacyl-CoA dehydratase n=1 Tax=Rhizoctonia solani 123E TaxID=1423351 RepID=A0A074RPG6_9AGAM|nr:tyrosine phosphatase [Rhizoctonia solani 123E]
MVSHPPTAGQPRASRGSPLVKYYLITYNIASCLGWLTVLVATLSHLSGRSITPPSTLARLFNAAKTPKTPYWLPSALHPIFKRACTTFAIGRVGPIVRVVQSGALLEVLHVLMGWVRSPLGTTAMQVASRVYLVWGVTESFSATRSSPFYATMVLAWSITEVIRYSFYACNLAGSEPRFLLWLRYTTFYILYPLGAASENALTFSTLPKSAPWSGKWTPYDLLRGFFVLIWVPGLYVMYTYMIKQRRKVLGGGKARQGSKSRLEHLQSRKRD